MSNATSISVIMLCAWLALSKCIVYNSGVPWFLLNSGGRSFASETSSQRSSMTRNCVDKLVGTPESAAILNNIVRITVDSGGDSPWASLDRYGRRRRSRRMPFWAPDDLDDDRHQNHGSHAATRMTDDEVLALSAGYQETVLSASSTSVRAAVEDFADSSMERSPTPTDRRQVTPLSQNAERTLADSAVFQQEASKADTTKTATAALALSWESGSIPDAAVASVRAISERDMLSCTEATEAAAGRRSRLLSGASAMFGRFVAHRRQRLKTVSGAEWRRRCDAPLKQQCSSSSSFHEASAISGDCGRLSEQSDTQNVTAGPAVKAEPDRTSILSHEAQQLSLSANVDSNSSGRRWSQRHVTNVPTPLSTAGGARGDTMALDVLAAATDAGVMHEHGVLQRTKSSKKRPVIHRYPSVERLDLPRRQSAAILIGGRSPHGADRKRAERFRRQYIDVKLQRQATPLHQPTSSTKSMPTGVDVCGTTRHDVVPCPHLLRVPASANVTLSWILTSELTQLEHLSDSHQWHLCSLQTWPLQLHVLLSFSQLQLNRLQHVQSALVRVVVVLPGPQILTIFIDICTGSRNRNALNTKLFLHVSSSSLLLHVTCTIS